MFEYKNDKFVVKYLSIVAVNCAAVTDGLNYIAFNEIYLRAIVEFKGKLLRTHCVRRD